VDVSHDASWFQGHFPGHPVLPAVAQLCDVVLAQAREAFPGVGRVRGAPRIKFARVVVPGDRLLLRLRHDVDRRLVHFELLRGEELCAGGTLRYGDA
jgi:3-hydroxyacyl-[acyl-carrier-protein] dehydratase